MMDMEGHNSSSEYNFCDKVVIITEASSSIGTSSAIKFTQLGANLVLVGSNMKHLQAVEKLCNLHSSRKPVLVIADINKDNDMEKLIETTIMHFNKIDILINNAGIVENGSILDTDVYQYDRVFNTNVRSIYHITNLCVPYLIASKGNIINVSSVTGIRSFPGVLAYSMSNAALDQFTKCIAVELAAKEVRVNSVNPGAIVTDFYKSGCQEDKNDEVFLDKCKNVHALRRAGDGQEVAETIAFLASNKASFITGTIIPVDGGRHIMSQQ